MQRLGFWSKAVGVVVPLPHAVIAGNTYGDVEWALERATSAVTCCSYNIAQHANVSSGCVGSLVAMVIDWS